MKNKLIVLRNEDVKRVLIGVPRGHKHLRVVIELSDGSKLVFQEATIANITRAYVSVITHPLRRGLELVGAKLEKRKRGFAEYQLVESSKDEESIIDEVTEVVLGC